MISKQSKVSIVKRKLVPGTGEDDNTGKEPLLKGG